MNAELYYPLVTEAIRRAETLEDLNAPGTAAAYLDVSLLEEKIAESLPASDPEGVIARRGAVRAALSARDLGRARALTERFLAEDEVDAELRRDLLELSRPADQEMREPLQLKVREERQGKPYGLLALLSVAGGLLIGVGASLWLDVLPELTEALSTGLIVTGALFYFEWRLHRASD